MLCIFIYFVKLFKKNKWKNKKINESILVLFDDVNNYNDHDNDDVDYADDDNDDDDDNGEEYHDKDAAGEYNNVDASAADADTDDDNNDDDFRVPDIYSYVSTIVHNHNINLLYAQTYLYIKVIILYTLHS